MTGRQLRTLRRRLRRRTGPRRLIGPCWWEERGWSPAPWTFERFASYLGIHSSTLSLYETGKRPIPPWVDVLLCENPPPKYPPDSQAVLGYWVA
jgi:transcriptional regulator with XRE-family HTH domain